MVACTILMTVNTHGCGQLDHCQRMGFITCVVRRAGTHIDMPSHFVHEAYEAGNDIEALNLDTVVGKYCVPCAVFVNCI